MEDYNSKNAGEGGKGHQTSGMEKIRKVGTYAGSEEGEGSPIELNLGQYDPKA